MDPGLSGREKDSESRRRLRLVFATANRRWTGGERCVTAVASGLAVRGHHVVVTYDPRGYIGERVGGGVMTVPVKVRNDGDPIAIARLARIIRRHRADVVCTHTVREVRIGGVAGRLAAATVVRRFGGIDPLGNDLASRIYYRLVLDAVIRDCDWGVKQVRMRNSWFKGPVFRGRNGVDTMRLAGLQAARRSELNSYESREILIGSLGRVEPAKGAPDLAAAVRRLTEHHRLPDRLLRLVYIGAVPADIETEIRRTVASSGERVRVSFLGVKPPEEAVRLLKACDIMAHPTRADSFNFAVLEAMAMGLPVIASRVGGLEEAIVDRESGFLVSLGDIEELATTLERLIGNERLRRVTGAAGRRRAADRLDEQIMIDEYETAFHQMATPSL